MNVKPSFLLCLLLLLSVIPLSSFAQTLPASPAPQLSSPNAVFAARAAAFKGASAPKAHYRAVYQLDSEDPKLIARTLRHMRNALGDPRLKDKLELELVVFAGGTVVFLKNQPYEADVLALQQAGVLLAQCQSSLDNQHLTKADLLPYISVVPTGNGELIIRQAEGWALVHP